MIYSRRLLRHLTTEICQCCLPIDLPAPAAMHTGTHSWPTLPLPPFNTPLSSSLSWTFYPPNGSEQGLGGKYVAAGRSGPVNLNDHDNCKSSLRRGSHAAVYGFPSYCECEGGGTQLSLSPVFLSHMVITHVQIQIERSSPVFEAFVFRSTFSGAV